MIRFAWYTVTFTYPTMATRICRTEQMHVRLRTVKVGEKARLTFSVSNYFKSKSAIGCPEKS